MKLIIHAMAATLVTNENNHSSFKESRNIFLVTRYVVILYSQVRKQKKKPHMTGTFFVWQILNILKRWTTFVLIWQSALYQMNLSVTWGYCCTVQGTRQWVSGRAESNILAPMNHCRRFQDIDLLLAVTVSLKE